MTEPLPETDDAGIAASVRGATASALTYIRARLQLAAVELQEAGEWIFKIAAALVAAVVLAIFGYLFFLLGIVFVIARFFENPHAWIWVSLAVALAHFIATAACLWFAYSQFQKPVFRATIAEFKKDEEWLTKKTN
jgi:uncharacterized membrane protein YqjE